MSGLPNYEGVARVRDILLGQSTTEKLHQELRERIKRDTETLAAVGIQYANNAVNLRSEMDKMDLTATGNTGHERRMHEFLLMLTEVTLKAKP